MKSDKQKPLTLASGEENSRITRQIMVWMNSFPSLPVKLVDYEMLAPDVPGMAVTVPQGAAIRRRYILGGHEAEFPFTLLYRLKPGDNADQRLEAVELLDGLGDYAVSHLPNLGPEARAKQAQVLARANLFARYENGDEDYQILLKIIYEVI